MRPIPKNPSEEYMSEKLDQLDLTQGRKRHIRGPERTIAMLCLWCLVTKSDLRAVSDYTPEGLAETIAADTAAVKVALKTLRRGKFIVQHQESGKNFIKVNLPYIESLEGIEFPTPEQGV